ncbi:MAG: hypothetical protein JW776_09665 [Candidatus Lokiarchaeota archaeon]|nr:hypothetical protein [Candidatus Lokiarchaeota archaeon]
MEFNDTTYKAQVIADLSNQDHFIQLIGVVQDWKNGSKFTLKDESGEISIEVPTDEPIFLILKDEMIVKVFGIVSETLESVKAEIISDYSGMDLEILKKTRKLRKQFLQD